MSVLFAPPPLLFTFFFEMHRSDFMLLNLCSYTVGMCGDGANDCGVSAGRLQLACADATMPLGESALSVKSKRSGN